MQGGMCIGEGCVQGGMCREECAGRSVQGSVECVYRGRVCVGIAVQCEQGGGIKGVCVCKDGKEWRKTSISKCTPTQQLHLCRHGTTAYIFVLFWAIMGCASTASSWIGGG